MKYLILLIMILGITSASAEDYWKEFFRHDINDYWRMSGRVPTNPTNDLSICIAAFDYKDGSMFHIAKDLDRGEFYLWIHNINWDFKKGDDELKLRVNLRRADNTVVEGGTLDWTIRTKNIIKISLGSGKAFIKGLWNNTLFIQVVMPGDSANIAVAVPGRAIVKSFEQCIKAYKSHEQKIPDISGPPTAKQTPAEIARRAKEQI